MRTLEQSGKSEGIVIAGCDKDLHLVMGALESACYFMPKIPICLLFDGQSDLKRIEEVYRVRVIRKENTRNKALREFSYGYGLTKMIAFWESPFEHFLYLDADACFWGDLISKYSLAKHDIVTPDMGCKYTADAVNKWFFSIKWIEQIDSHFNPLTFRSDYFCT